MSSEMHARRMQLAARQADSMLLGLSATGRRIGVVGLAVMVCMLVALAFSGRSVRRSEAAPPALASAPPRREQPKTVQAPAAGNAEGARAPKSVARSWKLAEVKEAAAILAERSRDSAVRYRCKAGEVLMVSAVEDNWCAVALEGGKHGWIARPALKFLGLTAVEVARGEGDAGIVEDAMKFLWVPYVRGGNSTAGTDCSGLVQSVFRKHGVKLPRTAKEQFSVGAPLFRGELRPGDRVFFSGSDGQVNHVGIYVGNGKFIHASGRHGRVVISKLSEYEDTYAGARR